MPEKRRDNPLVSIVILNWNGLEDTRQCLESVSKISYPNKEVIVVDNGSAPEQKAYLSKLKNIVYVDNPINHGFTGGHIDGYQRAQGEFIFLLNNDSVVQEDYLDIAVAKMQSNAKIGAIGGRSYFWNDECPIFDTSNPYYSFQEIDVVTGEARTLQYDYGQPQEVNNVSGSAVLVRRSVVEEIGYLFEPFFAYFEETDLFARMKRAGYIVMFHPQLRIWHRNGASSGASEGSYFFYYQIFRNRFIFALRNFQQRSLWPFIRLYFGIGFKSALRLILGRGSTNMNRAYSRAALVNLLQLPRWLYSRASLTRQLGVSRYNEQIYREQNGLSIVLDCVHLSDEELADLEVKLDADPDPMHEYVLVVPAKNTKGADSSLRANRRWVVDRGYFPARRLNLGAVAARFPWIAVVDPRHLPDIGELHHRVSRSYYSPAPVVVDQILPAASWMIVRRLYFVRSGGFPGHTVQEAITDFVTYAVLDGALSVGMKVRHQVNTSLQPARLETISQRRQINNRLLVGSDGLLARFAERHRRFAQVADLLHWLTAFSVPPRTKISRSVRLFIYAVTLRRRKLATELQHIRNEVRLYCSEGQIGRKINTIKTEKLKFYKRNPEQMPVFLIAYERVESMAKMVSWLESIGLKKIVFLDNNSSYPPLLDYYTQSPHQVLRLYRNASHTAPWSEGIIKALAPSDYYIVSDPDIIPTEECPKNVLSRFMTVHEHFPYHEKVGFALKIDDLPNHFPLKEEVIDWEKQFWLNQLEREVFEAGVDTTFAVYKPLTYKYQLYPSLRLGGKCAARHDPWYIDPSKISKEEMYYRSKADSGITSWNTDALPDRYANELKKKKSNNR